jgi:hypothetical protein
MSKCPTNGISETEHSVTGCCDVHLQFRFCQNPPTCSQHLLLCRERSHALCPEFRGSHVTAWRLHSACLQLRNACAPRLRAPPFVIFELLILFVGSRDSAVDIATGYGLNDGGIGVRIRVGSRIFSSPRRPDRLWGSPNFLSNWYRGLFPWRYSGKGVKLTTHLQPLPRSKERGSLHTFSWSSA